ncbi:hypothetical protein [Campylobacter coli]|uniref:hypothetical protein n=1 Tax=Campylobacter coli TaxID=195 RepID=UPI00073EC6A0|nr:hypothetical protein [Campylobacter coli]HEB7547527.1 hypothetical protein [Campylobacter coli]HEH5403934.1 hypothetical protein [Campylobacter coli]
MENKKAFFIILCLIHILFYCILVIFKWINLNIILSYEFAFFSILLIVFTSYSNYKKFILAQAKNHQKDFIYPSLFYIKKIEKLPRIVKFISIKDDLTLNFKDRLRFFTLFFALFKLIAYGVLVAGFLFLHRQDKLDILSYICGISSLLVCVFIFMLYIRRYESKKNH